MKNNCIIMALFICTSIFSCKEQRESGGNYPDNRLPLTENAFIELPLGAIRAEGWLKEQLIRQKNGLTGHLDKIYPLVMGESNGWLGGEGDQWERGPYWIDGLLPLAYLLDDDELKQKALRWIEWSINSQREDGYFGPQTSYPNTIPGVQRDNCDDWWPKMVMLKALQQYYSATGDERVIALMTKYFHYQLKELPEKQLDFRTFWAKYRGGDNLMVVLWLYNITGDTELLKLADIIYEQTFDYYTKFNSHNWWATGSMHCVNLAQGLKTLAIQAQYKNKEDNLSVLKKGFTDIVAFLGYPHGGFGGDETLHGNNPTQGTELCTLVEYMFSLEKMLQISGDLDYAGQIERIAFNALPAQTDDEFMNRQYYQQTNQVCVTKHYRNFDVDHAGTDVVFSLLGGYPCCTSNMHQAFPKFVQNLCYATSDKGLALLIYSPAKIAAKVGNGTKVTIEEKTAYPFSENILLSVNPEHEVDFPLYLRIPDWCENPSIKVNGIIEDMNTNGHLLCIRRSWKQGDEVQIIFPMHVGLSKWHERSSAVERGPLVYALKMNENRTKKKFEGDEKKWFGDDYTEIVSDTPWNYALINCRKEEIAKQYEVYISDKTAVYPWNIQNAPIEIKTLAKQLPQWQLYDHSAGPLPISLAYGMRVGQTDSITLIPYGCTKLRIAEFPVTGR
jgi:DUF1680 family protein